jgi:hypothetical protein
MGGGEDFTVMIVLWIRAIRMVEDFFSRELYITRIRMSIYGIFLGRGEWHGWLSDEIREKFVF